MAFSSLKCSLEFVLGFQHPVQHTAQLETGWPGGALYPPVSMMGNPESDHHQKESHLPEG